MTMTTMTDQQRLDARICRVCEANIRRDAHRCTNGLCGTCHRRFCSAGGVTTTGHGVDVQRARQTLDRENGAAIRDALAPASGKWKVWCTVSGGVTGTRQAFLKVNDEEVEFDTREAADAECARLRLMMLRSASRATFSYVSWPAERS
jgi:hypothetical protein